MPSLVTQTRRMSIGSRAETTVTSTRFRSNPHFRAAILASVAMIACRIAIGADAGWIMLPFLLLMVGWMTRISPAVTSLVLLFGWVLFGSMDFPGFGFLPRIPAISLLFSWVIVILVYRRMARASTRKRTVRLIWGSSLLLILFLLLGVAGAELGGFLQNPYVRFYNLDLIRTWLGYLILGFFACCTLSDFLVVLRYLPFAFLIFPLSFPVSVWILFIKERLVSSDVFGVGLSFGSLNPNTLGQAAAVASIAAAAVLGFGKSRHKGLIAAALCASSGITFLTSSRQALLSWMAGVFLIGFLMPIRRALIWISGVVMAAAVVVGMVYWYLPADSGFKVRLVELTRNMEVWESQSALLRVEDMQAALSSWQDHPLFGVGFGAQRADEIPDEFVPDEESDQITPALRGTHNLFLGILAQTGVVGLMLFLSFIVCATRRFLRALKSACNSPGEIRLARTASFALLVCFFVQYNLSGALGMGSHILIFFMGLLLGVQERNPQTREAYSFRNSALTGSA